MQKLSDINCLVHGQYDPILLAVIAVYLHIRDRSCDSQQKQRTDESTLRVKRFIIRSGNGSWWWWPFASTAELSADFWSTLRERASATSIIGVADSSGPTVPSQ